MAAAGIGERTQVAASETGRRANPLQAALTAVRAGRPQPIIDAAAARRCAQLPSFAPLLEELEIAGWSSHRRFLSGNFHDWLLLDNRAVLVTVGRVVGSDPFDPSEAALVAQSTWATIRAHAHHVRDAGTLLSFTSHSLWPMASAALQVCAAVVLIDLAEGHASVAMAGDCLAWRVRAATTEQLAIRQPMLGGETEFTYLNQTIQLAPRERLLLVADNPRRQQNVVASIATAFSDLDAESHRRMLATDALGLVREHLDCTADAPSSATSIVAVRRR